MAKYFFAGAASKTAGILLSLALAAPSVAASPTSSLSEPALVGEAKAHVLDALSSQWLALLPPWLAAEASKMAKIVPARAGSAEAARASWSSVDGCLLELPSVDSAEASLAKDFGVGKLAARRMGLARLMQLHELGHCDARSGKAHFSLPGLDEESALAIDKLMASPVWSSWERAGEFSRAWGESYADAYMAARELASYPGQGAALEAVASWRQSNDSAQGRAQALAIRAASKWASEGMADPVAVASWAASAAVLEAYGISAMESIGDARMAMGLDGASLAEELSQEAAASWVQANGRKEALPDFEFDGGFGDDRQAQAARFAAWRRLAIDLSSAAFGRQKGWSWRSPDDRRAAKAMRESEAEISRALASEWVSGPELQSAWSKASIAAKAALSPLLDKGADRIKKAEGRPRI